MEDNQQTENKKPRQNTYRDILEFQDIGIYSSIGKMQLSTKVSQPKFGFSLAKREEQDKVFTSKNLAKQQFVGKGSPGPIYNIRNIDDKKLQKDQRESNMCQAARNTLDTYSKYDFYNREDKDFDPITADDCRRNVYPQVRFGVENRFLAGKGNKVPGPQYDPNINAQVPVQQIFSFGPPKKPIKTTGKAIVGPGSYIPKEVPKTSQVPNESKYSFPKQQKFGIPQRQWDINQTYDDNSKSIGFVFNSRKPNAAYCGFGKAKRDAPVGLFGDHMANANQKVRIPHPPRY